MQRDSSTFRDGRPLPPAVNFHLWQPCNMRCRGCFAVFADVRRDVLPAGHLDRAAALRLTRVLAAEFDKITFVGGEPTLCPWLPELIDEAAGSGCTTMLVSNGTRLDRDALQRLAGSLGWLALSIDSPSSKTHVALGRAIRGRAIPDERYLEIIEQARALGIRIKINTVVSRLNAEEDFHELIQRAKPERWKVFQVLPVKGQNDGTVEPLLVTKAQLNDFVRRHRDLSPVGEDNDAMRGSYAMVDPAGRFFDNVAGGHSYGAPILDVGVSTAWRSVSFDLERFMRRGGVYGW